MRQLIKRLRKTLQELEQIERTLKKNTKVSHLCLRKAYRDGFDSGITWPSQWEHSPGGPWVMSESVMDSSEVKEECLQTRLDHKAWMMGWKEGHAYQLEVKLEKDNLV